MQYHASIITTVYRTVSLPRIAPCACLFNPAAASKPLIFFFLLISRVRPSSECDLIGIIQHWPFQTQLAFSQQYPLKIQVSFWLNSSFFFNYSLQFVYNVVIISAVQQSDSVQVAHLVISEQYFIEWVYCSLFTHSPTEEHFGFFRF